MKAATDIRLLVGNSEILGWDRWTTESCILTPSDAFSFSMPNVDGGMAAVVVPGQGVKLVLDKRLVLKGYVDEVVYAAGRVEVQGRDVFAQLLDCSADPGTHQQVTLDVLARKLSAPWGLQWQVKPGLSLSSQTVKVEPGETVWDVLMRAAKKDQVLLWCLPDGVGYIGRPDYSQAPTYRLRRRIASGTEENNVIDGTIRISWRDRYATVTVAGTSGNTKWSWAEMARRKAAFTDVGPLAAAQSWTQYTPEVLRDKVVTKTSELKDPGVLAPRPLLVTDGDCRSYKQAMDRAKLEVARRRHDAIELEYTVPGHYGDPYDAADGPTLWEAGKRADVLDEEAGVKGVFHLTRRKFELGEGGPQTSLVLHPEGWMA